MASRLEELWARWMSEGELDAAEKEELTAALAEDGDLRDDFIHDQRIEGALRALGRGAHDRQAFARRFAERVSAERDDRGFVSSFEKRIRQQVPPRARSRAVLIAAVLVPAAAVVALVATTRKPAPAPAPVALPSEPPAPSLPPPSPAPASAAPAVVGRIERVTGAAYVLANAHKTAAVAGAPLAGGSTIFTVGKDSRASVSLLDRSAVELGGDTSLQPVAEDRRGDQQGIFLARGRLDVQRPGQLEARPVLVTTPHAEVSASAARFALLVDGRGTRLDVEQGQAQIAGHGRPPVTVHGSEYVVLSEGNEASVVARPRGAALFVVGSLTLSAGDERVRRRLTGLGFEVRVRGSGAPDPEELRHATLVLISSTVYSLDVNTQYRDVGVPIVAWEPSLFDDLALTGPEENGDCGAGPSTGEAVVRHTSHPLAAGLSGLVQLVTPPARGTKGARRPFMSFGIPGPSAIWIATWPGQPERALAFAYDRGAPMVGLAAAPARRVGLFAFENNTTLFTEDGWSLFDAAVLWASDSTASR
jgi:negative regulator of sigma E activity